MSSPSRLPLHWESTGDKWWYASPIDLAAANGHYDIVRELLRLDMNLLIKLTSLRRIQRLEALWEEDSCFVNAAKSRAIVAYKLLLECERGNNKNSLIQAGYGGWLLYTAAAAGDNGFVQELLERDPLLVFGEGEYGVTDILFSAASSKDIDVFRTIFECLIEPLADNEEGSEEEVKSGGAKALFFKSEMVNRAVFAAARGGNLEILKELFMESPDVLAYRDSHGATILHASAGRGQIEIVNYLLANFKIIESKDNQGNTALHIAAFRGHLKVVEALISVSSSLPLLKNNDGNTLLHMAVSGFQTPNFRRLDSQMELVQQLISGNIISINEIINMQNNNRRTALHTAVIGNLHYDLVELFMTVPTIDVNIQDINGMTPLDLLSQRICSASSNLLIKRLVSAGGIPNLSNLRIKSVKPSQLKKHSVIENSPGTSFRITDSEIFLYTGLDTAETSGRLSFCSTASRSGSENHTNDEKPLNSVRSAVNKLRIFLGLSADDDSLDSINSGMKWSKREEMPTPLRRAYSNGGVFMTSNKRMARVRSSVPSPSTKKKFTASLMYGIFRTMPQLAPYSQPQTPLSPFSCSQVSSPMSEKHKSSSIKGDNIDKNCEVSFSLNALFCKHERRNSSKKSGLINAKLMNKYFCVGANSLEVKNPSVSKSHSRFVPPVG